MYINQNIAMAVVSFSFRVDDHSHDEAILFLRKLGREPIHAKVTTNFRVYKLMNIAQKNLGPGIVFRSYYLDKQCTIMVTVLLDCNSN